MHFIDVEFANARQVAEAHLVSICDSNDCMKRVRSGIRHNVRQAIQAELLDMEAEEMYAEEEKWEAYSEEQDAQWEAEDVAEWENGIQDDDGPGYCDVCGGPCCME